MSRIGILFLFLIYTIHLTGQGHYSYSKDTILMGSAFAFTAISETKSKAQVSVREGIKEVIRIEKLISSWDVNSQTSTINKNAGIAPVKVDVELINLIERCLKISKISNGYFDISFASMDKVWEFKNQELLQLPSKENIEKSVSKIDFTKIKIDKELQTVFLMDKGMKIGFGAIGKGYAADRAKMQMKNSATTSGVVNAGGDLVAWGEQETGKPWSIAIADPEDKNSVLAWMDISEMAVVTSGNYEKYFLFENKKYCHIVDPKTGWPISGIKSVTIISRTAEFSDAIATTTFILGPKDGMDLINHLEGVEAIIVNDLNEVFYSKNIQTKYFRK